MKNNFTETLHDLMMVTDTLLSTKDSYISHQIQLMTGRSLGDMYDFRDSLVALYNCSLMQDGAETLVSVEVNGEVFDRVFGKSTVDENLDHFYSKIKEVDILDIVRDGLRITNAAKVCQENGGEYSRALEENFIYRDMVISLMRKLLDIEEGVSNKRSCA